MMLLFSMCYSLHLYKLQFFTIIIGNDLNIKQVCCSYNFLFSSPCAIPFHFFQVTVERFFMLLLSLVICDFEMVVILTVKHVVDDVAADYAMFLLTASDAVLH